MAQIIARRLTVIFIFLLIFFTLGQIDYYYSISERVISHEFVTMLAKFFNVYGMAEPTMDIADWVSLLLNLSATIIVFSFIKNIKIAFKKEGIKKYSFFTLKSILKIHFKFILWASISYAALDMIDLIIDLSK